MGRKIDLEEIVLNLLREQGIWAMLFVALLRYVLRKNEEQDKREAAREAACQALLKQFAEELRALRAENSAVEAKAKRNEQ